MLNKCYITAILLLVCFSITAQEKETDSLNLPKEVVVEKVVKSKEYDPLRPSKAAFYSAILPGLGQAYNKKYWKVPIVVGAITGGILIYDFNNKEYKRYRNAYKSRLAGFTNDEFYGIDQNGNPLSSPIVSDDGLREAQKLYRKNKEISLLVTVGIYILNIIDANVDAHLLQYNVDDNLSLAPHFKIEDINKSSNLGVTLNFKF